MIRVWLRLHTFAEWLKAFTERRTWKHYQGAAARDTMSGRHLARDREREGSRT